MMDRVALRAALDACLLSEDEIDEIDYVNDDALNDDDDALKDDDDARNKDRHTQTIASAGHGLCFSPWPEQTTHLASLGVRLGGRGSAALAMAAQTRLHAWSGDGEGGGTGGSNANSAVESVTTGVATLKLIGTAGLQFGGKVGVHRAEAFAAPPRGTESKQFPEGTGHFWPKMPCLECGSPWWLGDSWDAEVRAFPKHHIPPS